MDLTGASFGGNPLLMAPRHNRTMSDDQRESDRLDEEARGPSYSPGDQKVDLEAMIQYIDHLSRAEYRDQADRMLRDALHGWRTERLKVETHKPEKLAWGFIGFMLGLYAIQLAASFLSAAEAVWNSVWK